MYSSKVFLGGLPYGIDEKKVLEFCTGFGNVEQIEWPGKASALDHKGFVYVTFSDGASVCREALFIVGFTEIVTNELCIFN